MKFGVMLRSIGERTERLCFESVAQHVSQDHIHVLRDYCPSYKVYQEMFRLAKKHEYDWYLGVDADVILRREWWEMFNEKLKSEIVKERFKFAFHVLDSLTGQLLVGGGQFYNGKYTDLSLKYLKKSIKIGRFWFYYKHKGYGSSCFTKPETSIRTHMKNEMNILDEAFPEMVGWHAAEQRYSEVFRRIITRYHRDPAYNNRKGSEFLNIDINELLKGKNKDKYIARLAWDQASRWKLTNVDKKMIGKINEQFVEMGIDEKEELTMSLDDFYRKMDKARG